MRRNIIQSYFEVAIDHSMKAIPKYSSRKAVIGAIGIRRDNKIVHAHNGGAKQHHPDSHAEARLCSKLGPGATVFIARIRRDNFCLDLAKPCINCFKRLKGFKVEKIYYSISDNEYGVISNFDNSEEDSYSPDFGD